LHPAPQSVERSQPLLRSREGIPIDEIGSGFNRARPDRVQHGMCVADCTRSDYQKSPLATHQGLPLLGEVTTPIGGLLSPLFADYLLPALSVLLILGSGLHRSQEPVRSLSISGQRSFTACHCRNTDWAPEMYPAGFGPKSAPHQKGSGRKPPKGLLHRNLFRRFS